MFPSSVQLDSCRQSTFTNSFNPFSPEGGWHCTHDRSLNAEGLIGLCYLKAQKWVSSQVTTWLYSLSLFCFLLCCLCIVDVFSPAPAALGFTLTDHYPGAEREVTSYPEGPADISRCLLWTLIEIGCVRWFTPESWHGVSSIQADPEWRGCPQETLGPVNGRMGWGVGWR